MRTPLPPLYQIIMDIPLQENRIWIKGRRSLKDEDCHPSNNWLQNILQQNSFTLLSLFSSGFILKESVNQNFFCGMQIYRLFCKTFESLSCSPTPVQAESTETFAHFLLPIYANKPFLG